MITQALLRDTDKTIYYWQSFIRSIDENLTEEKAHIYYAVAIFALLKPLNRVSSYKKPYYYKKMLQSFIELFIALDSDKDISQDIERVQKSMQHKRVVNLYASMEYYPDESVDYSLLLPELFAHNYRALEYLNEELPKASNDEKSLVATLSKITQMLFGSENYELNYTLLAMRYGDRERDINPLLEEITND